MSDPLDHPVLPTRVLAERTQLVIPTLLHWIDPTVEYLRNKAVLGGACDESRSGKLMIALHEAITNAVIHGNLEVSSELKEGGGSAFAEALARRSSDRQLSARSVDITVDYNGETCSWIITDEGKGFDVEYVLQRCLSNDPEIMLASGRGILMMKSFLDDVRFEQGGRRVILTLQRDSGAEKRKDSRRPVAAPFKVTPLAADGQPLWGLAYDALSRNVSENGMAILQEKLSHSQKILIGIPTEDGVLNIPAEVKHSRPFGNSGMELGCHFTQVIEPTRSPPKSSAAEEPEVARVQRAVLDFLDGYEAKQLPGHERREHPRVVYNERVTMLVPGGAAPIIGYARDLSKGGMALITQEPVPGEINIAFAPLAEQQLLRIRCRVMRCDCIKEGFYDVGVAFMRLEEERNA